MPDAVAGLVAVHYGHGAVHENEAVAVRVVVHGVGLFDEGEGFLAIKSFVYDACQVPEPRLLQHCLHPEYIVRLVVDDHDSSHWIVIPHAGED